MRRFQYPYTGIELGEEETMKGTLKLNPKKCENMADFCRIHSYITFATKFSNNGVFERMAANGWNSGSGGGGVHGGSSWGGGGVPGGGGGGGGVHGGGGGWWAVAAQLDLRKQTLILN